MRKILVVVDMQNDFITGCLGNEECVAVVPAVVDTIMSGNYDEVAVTRDTHHEDYLKTQEGRKLPVEHCIENTEGWELVNEVKDAIENSFDENNIRYFNKSVFGSVELAEYLSKQEEKNEGLVIDFVGVCTGICVISNVMLAKAFCTNADIRVIANACACVCPKSHNTALEAMKTCQVDIL